MPSTVAASGRFDIREAPVAELPGLATWLPRRERQRARRLLRRTARTQAWAWARRSACSTILARSTRESALSLRKMLRRCVSIVFWLR